MYFQETAYCEGRESADIYLLTQASTSTATQGYGYHKSGQNLGLN